MMRILLAFFVCSMVLACKSDNKPAPVVTEKPVEEVKTGDELEAMPAAEIKRMFDEVDQIDYEFHSLPISMALNEKMGIQNNIRYISPSVQWMIPEDCKPLGKQLFYSKANLMYEADLYFDDNCRFLVFLKDGQPLYCNKFTPHGQKFYENVFQQVAGMQAK